MGALNLEMFTHAGTDIEAAQYRVMAGLIDVQRQLHHNRLYPHLGDLIEMTSVLETILANRDAYRTSLPKTLTGIDLSQRTLTFDAVPADAEAIERVFTLITWAVPRLKATTEEGMAVFDFVSENLEIGEVGVVPLYRDEGYAFVADLRDNVYHVIRYHLSLLTAAEEQYRAMKTEEIQQRPFGSPGDTPEAIKLDFIRAIAELPNPATFVLETDLDFPFEQTILPVAKRKLMRHLIS